MTTCGSAKRETCGRQKTCALRPPTVQLVHMTIISSVGSVQVRTHSEMQPVFLIKAFLGLYAIKALEGYFII